MKILLVCNQGMSTGILVESMYNYAEKEDYIEAVAVSRVSKVIEGFDIVLVGPQIRYKLSELSALAQKYNKKIALIDMQAYGMMDGQKVMQQVKNI